MRLLSTTILLFIPVAFAVPAIAQELKEELEFIEHDLAEAKQIHESLKQRTTLAERRVKLLTDLKSRRRELVGLVREVEDAEEDGDESRLEELEEKINAAEFGIEFLEAKREVLDARSDLFGLIAELPVDAEDLQAEGGRLRRMAIEGEELVDRMFNAWREDREEEGNRLEEEYGELEEHFHHRRERLELLLQKFRAEEEGDDEWIAEIEEALQEFEDFDEPEGDGEPRRREREVSVAPPPMPPPLEFSDKELTAVAAKSFEKEIVPLLKSACFSCHDGDSASGDLNIESLIAVKPLVKNRQNWVNIIQQLKVRSMPPADAAPMAEADRRMATAWLTNAIERFDYDRVRQPGYEPARRLTHEEYNNTIRDLIGIDLRPADRFPADMSAASGFDNSANSLFIQPVLLERYLGAAEYVVDNAFPVRSYARQSVESRTAAPGAGLTSGDGSDESSWTVLLGDMGDLESEAGIRKVLRSFASRAFRRPAEPSEVDRLVKHYKSQIASGRSEHEAIKDLIQVVLVSPSFLIRAEADSESGKGPWLITDYELANRLSYFLWASMPDTELFEAAECGTLHQPDVISREVERMLADPKAESLGQIFASQWLQFAALDRVQRDQIDNPWATDSLVDGMKEESAMLFNSIVADNAPIERLVDADYTFVNEELAKHYRMPNVRGDKLRRVSLSDSPRRGIMGHGSILAVTSFPGRTSPVVRGNWILSELLGTPPPPPPPNVSEFDERVRENERLTARRKLELHRNNPNCYGCHSQIDPLGFALEEFEWFGRHQPRRRGKSVDTTAQLPEGIQFKGLKGLSQALVSERIDDLTFQITRKMLSYALGRQLEYYDEALVRDLVAQMNANDRKIRTLIHGITQSDTFLKKQKSD